MISALPTLAFSAGVGGAVEVLVEKMFFSYRMGSSVISSSQPAVELEVIPEPPSWSPSVDAH